MADETSNRESLRWQAAFCRRSGAPILARVCEALADLIDRSTETGRRVLDWPGEPMADALPLRLAGPFHALVRAGKSERLAAIYRGEVAEVEEVRRDLSQVLLDFDAEIVRWLDGPPQTNEPARSGVLMAGLLELAQRFGPRFDLIEIGSSAGLNLLIDRYSFDLGGVTNGPVDAAIHIKPEWRGPPPPAAEVRIERVRGVDIAPIDLSQTAAAERLMAYVWVDQKDRLARTAKAIELARADPPDLVQGDAAEWVEARLADRQEPGVTRVLMHSIVWQYLPSETQRRIEAAMAAAGALATAEKPLGWIAYEADRTLNLHTLTVRSWPGGGAAKRLAMAHPHGAWIEWEGVVFSSVIPAEAGTQSDVGTGSPPARG